MYFNNYFCTIVNKKIWLIELKILKQRLSIIGTILLPPQTFIFLLTATDILLKLRKIRAKVQFTSSKSKEMKTKLFWNEYCLSNYFLFHKNEIFEITHRYISCSVNFMLFQPLPEKKSFYKWHKVIKNCPTLKQQNSKIA